MGNAREFISPSGVVEARLIPELCRIETHRRYSVVRPGGNARELLYNRDAFVEAYHNDTGAARKRRVTRVISTMETGPGAIPGGVGVSALGSKVRDYNIPGMPFRVHQFGTPVPSLRSSLFTTPRARARVFSPSCPSCLPSRRAVQSVPDEREAPWKRITLVPSPRAYARARENERAA